MNKGHEKLSCMECHEPANGNTQQQIQSNVKHWLEFTSEASPFGYVTPDNKDCLSCHEREDDNHPIYRFNEPKFNKVREAIHPERCVSCHQEHRGVRVTSEPNNCKHCHEDLSLKKDKISPEHNMLIKKKNWTSCLACHDFHGNHKRETPRKKEHMISEHTLKDYFLGGKDPYGDKKITKIRETRYED
jgi:nitrate reductase cytochrome c-type subunit